MSWRVQISSLNLDVLSGLLSSGIKHFFENNILIDVTGIESFQHKGVVLTIGSLRIEIWKDQTDLINSCNQLLKKIKESCLTNKIDYNQIAGKTAYITVIQDYVYLPDPLNWNDKEDGIYFMWGDRYHAYYLPSQIRALSKKNKIEILDKLCATECKVTPSLWRTECGLVWKLICSESSFQTI